MLAFDQGDLAATATEHDAEAPGRRRIRTIVLRGTGVRDRARPGTADRRRSGPTRFGSSRAHSRPARCASGPTTSFLARPIVSWRSLAVLGLRERQAGRVQRQSGAPRRRAARLCQPRYSGRGQRGLASSGLHGGPKFARNFGESPFGLFVIELPLSAACATVTLAGKGPDATEPQCGCPTHESSFWSDHRFGGSARPGGERAHGRRQAMIREKSPAVQSNVSSDPMTGPA